MTLEQALNIVALQSKAFWRPVTSNIIFVAPDQPQKRKDYEEEIVKTFYLKNTVLPQELTEIVTSIRQLLDLRRVQQINAQNAIVIRDTPDRVMLAQKIIDDIDKAKPEVVIQVAVLQARTRPAQEHGNSARHKRLARLYAGRRFDQHHHDHGYFPRLEPVAETFLGGLQRHAAGSAGVLPDDRLVDADHRRS